MKVIDRLDWNLLEDQKDTVIEVLTTGYEITARDPMNPNDILWGLVEFLADLIDEHDTGKEVKNQHLHSREKE